MFKSRALFLPCDTVSSFSIGFFDNCEILSASRLPDVFIIAHYQFLAASLDEHNLHAPCPVIQKQRCPRQGCRFRQR